MLEERWGMDYSKQKVIQVLSRDVEQEFRTIRTYLENLDDLNYANNRKKIDVLVLESLTHATWLTKQILDLHKESANPLSKLAFETVAKEEVALHDIYAFELERTADADVRKLLKKLMDAEVKHEQLVRTLV